MERNVRVAIFSPFSLPEASANALRVESFRKHFSGQGINVKVFSPLRDGFDMDEVPQGYYRYTGLLDASNIVFNGDFDLVLGTSPPLTHSFIAGLAGKLSGKKFIVDLRDPWTHAYQGLGIYSPFNPKLWAFKIMEALAYNLADNVFAATGATAKIAAKKTLRKGKIVVVENGSTPSVFRPDRAMGDATRKRLGIPKNAKVCIYAGAFAKKGVDELISETGKTMLGSGAYLLLVIPLSGTEQGERKTLEKAIMESVLKEKIRVVDSTGLPSERMYEFYSAADLGLDPLPKGMEDYCIPVKTYDFFSCGIPVIGKGAKGSELEKIVAGNSLGWFAEDWKGFNAKLAIALKGAELGKMGSRARELSQKRFDRKFANEKALAKIRGLLENTNRQRGSRKNEGKKPG